MATSMGTGSGEISFLSQVFYSLGLPIVEASVFSPQYLWLVMRPLLLFLVKLSWLAGCLKKSSNFHLGSLPWTYQVLTYIAPSLKTRVPIQREPQSLTSPPAITHFFSLHVSHCYS
jgi:hypothetical protein